MTFVLDSSLALTFVLEDEATPGSDAIYDAAYLEAAIRHGVTLGSLDTGLRAAAKTEKVPLLPEKPGI